MRDLGYSSYVGRKKSKDIWYNVIAGKYGSLQEAKAAAERIAAQGYKYYISDKGR